MEDKKQVIPKRKANKNVDKIRKIQMFKETANNAMQDATEFDKTIIESNDEYINRLCEADAAEYELLKMNMDKAESEGEREAIRKVMCLEELEAELLAYGISSRTGRDARKQLENRLSYDWCQGRKTVALITE